VGKDALARHCAVILHYARVRCPTLPSFPHIKNARSVCRFARLRLFRVLQGPLIVTVVSPVFVITKIIFSPIFLFLPPPLFEGVMCAHLSPAVKGLVLPLYFFFFSFLLGDFYSYLNALIRTWVKSSLDSLYTTHIRPHFPLFYAPLFSLFFLLFPFDCYPVVLSDCDFDFLRIALVKLCSIFIEFRTPLNMLVVFSWTWI